MAKRGLLKLQTNQVAYNSKHGSFENHVYQFDYKRSQAQTLLLSSSSIHESSSIKSELDSVTIEQRYFTDFMGLNFEALLTFPEPFRKLVKILLALYCNMQTMSI